MLQVFCGVLHPFQLKTGGAVVETAESFHPLRLLGGWNLSETHQGDSNATLAEPGRELASVVPHPTDGVGRHQYMHGGSDSHALCAVRLMTQLPSVHATSPVAAQHNVSRPSW